MAAPKPPPPPPEPPDQDNDGLTDADETGQYGTDPLKPDSDADGLRDGAEVHHYGTDPNRPDTDGGTVDDGTEVRRGSDPLDPLDDVPKQEPAPSPTPQPRTIYFDSGVFWETPAMRAELDALAAWLLEHPHRKILLRGHSDSSARSDYNLWLSRQRARVVRDYLVEKGIERGRITTEGVGDREPAGPNSTVEGRRMNRRVEIRVTQ
jgi:outer membrane protein OmpA-like peptidoglycan-associated protein